MWRGRRQGHYGCLVSAGHNREVGAEVAQAPLAEGGVFTPQHSSPARRFSPATSRNAWPHNTGARRGALQICRGHAILGQQPHRQRGEEREKHRFLAIEDSFRCRTRTAIEPVAPPPADGLDCRNYDIDRQLPEIPRAIRHDSAPDSMACASRGARERNDHPPVYERWPGRAANGR